MSLLDDHYIAVDCPECGYPMDVQLRTIRLQEIVFCSACKVSIQLVDESASAHRANEKLDSALNDLRREFQKLDKAITVKF